MAQLARGDHEREALFETNEAAHRLASGAPAARARTGRFAALATGIGTLLALVMSGISLYTTVLKQAELSLFVPDTISYTRDPDGGHEVIVVPVTIANSGARDAVVTHLRLALASSDGGKEKMFYATFEAGDAYFSTKEDLAARTSRPKTAFAPVTVPGRSGVARTILFYPRSDAKDRVVKSGGTFTGTVTAAHADTGGLGVLDDLLKSEIKPVSFTATLPKVAPYFDGYVLSGGSVRLDVTRDTPR